MLEAVLLLLVQASPGDAPPLHVAPDAARGPEPRRSDDVIVRGQRLQGLDAALKDCIARGCPPDEDVKASLALADGLFQAGEYRTASRTLAASARRNRRHANRFPVEVSNLQRANARVYAHLGEQDMLRSTSMDALNALKQGMSEDDPRVLAARVQLADTQVVLGRHDLADAQYARIAARAAALKLPGVEAYAMLRRAAHWMALAQVEGKYRARADAALDELAARSNVPEQAGWARAARLLKARLAAQSGDKAALERVLAEFRADGPGTRPTLIYSEPIQLPAATSARSNPNDPLFGQDIIKAPIGGGVGTMGLGTAGQFADQWMDVGFWIDADGTPNQIEQLRQGRGFDDSWTRPIFNSIATRRYAPLRIPPGEPGLFRVERYTMTANWTVATGTNMRVRSPIPKIEMVDLSDAPVESATSGS